MAIPITIPRLGWNMEEGMFVGWLKADGDAVRPGDAVFRSKSEKATEEIESLDAGMLHIPADGPKPGDQRHGRDGDRLPAATGREAPAPNRLRSRAGES